MTEISYMWKVANDSGRLLTPRGDPHEYESPADLMFPAVDDAKAWYEEDLDAYAEGEDDAEVEYMRRWVLCKVETSPVEADDTEDEDATEGAEGDIDAHVQVFARGDAWWLQITGDLFGPFQSDDQAIDAIPTALRDTF